VRLAASDSVFAARAVYRNARYIERVVEQINKSYDASFGVLAR